MAEIPDFKGGPQNWVLLSCDQCGRKNAIGAVVAAATRHVPPEQAFPDDWCVIVLTLHPKMRGPGRARLRGATLCPDCNPYRLGPDGEPAHEPS